MTLLTDRVETAPEARSFLDLARLIHPVDTTTFKRDYWEKKPLLVKRGDPDYYADLLTLDDLDDALTVSGRALDRIRVVIDGAETPISALHSEAGTNALELLYERYRTGSTIVLNALEQCRESLQRFTRLLGAELSARAQVNVYMTPAGNQGFMPHYDMHDVFIAQVHGTKHWRIAGQPYELPMKGQSYDKSQPAPTPDQEFDLQPGDVLYMPRGTVHWATANEHASAHITLGVHPVLYSQVIEQAVKSLIAEDVRFRRGLPVGFAGGVDEQQRAAETLVELVGVLTDKLSPQDMVAGAVRRATSISYPALRHHLTDLEHLEQIGLDTRVRLRQGLQFSLATDGDTLNLHFHGKTVQLPAYVADEVRYVVDNEYCTGASIPGDLDEDGRIVLIRTLVREGLLTSA